MWRSSDPDSDFDYLDAVDAAVDCRSGELADRCDELASAGFYVYDPDDREPAAGDPLWAEDWDMA